MTVTHALARPMLAGMFVYGGFDALRNPESKAPKAESIAPAIAEPLGLPTDTVTLVRLNGAVQVVGGTLLALGKMPRLAAMALAASLVPTTYAGHRFWEETDERQRAQQRVHFLKNVGMFGGLIMAATDTGGRPSLTWRARRAVRRATTTSHPVTERAAGMARDRAEDAMDAFATMSSGAADARQRASKATRRAAKRAATGAAHASAAASAASAAVAGAKAAERARALGAKAGEVAVQRTRDVVEHARDGGFERAKDAALELARETVDRAREVLPVAV